MIKAVLFDLDGPLLNREESVKKFIDKQYDRLHNRLNAISKERYISRFIQLDNRGYVWKDQVYQQLVDEFSIITITWEELLQDYMNEFKNSCVAFPNLISLLEALKGAQNVGMMSVWKKDMHWDNAEADAIVQDLSELPSIIKCLNSCTNS